MADLGRGRGNPPHLHPHPLILGKKKLQKDEKPVGQAFLSCLLPLRQNGSSIETIHKKIWFIFMQIKLIFRGLVLTQ